MCPMRKLITFWSILCTMTYYNSKASDIFYMLFCLTCCESPIIYSYKRMSESDSHSVLSDSLWPRGLQPTRLLCPWGSPGKDTGVSPGKSPGVACHFLLQGIFPTQGLNPGLLPWQVDSLPFWATREAHKWAKESITRSITGLFSIRKPDFTFPVCSMAVRRQDSQE